MIRKAALAACLSASIAGASLVSTAHAAANPLGVAFKHVTNVEKYGKPTGMLIAGRCNRYNQAFQQARAKGAEVLAYLNPTTRPDHYVCALDEQFYLGDRGRVPLWPYPSYGQRLIWPNTKLVDMRAGSSWNTHVVNYIEKLMRERKVDGVFLDVVGARPWGSLAEWNSWSQKEKDAWTDGAIDLVKRLDARRRAVNPDFIIVVNNIWNRGDSRGYAGEKYVDGVMLEHTKYSSTWHKNYIKRPFAEIGNRRILVIANSTAEARLWAKVPGVTHVSDQTTPQYTRPNVPVVSFSRLK